MKNNFISKYLEDLSKFIKPNNEIIHKLELLKDLIINIKSKKSKILIFGNGGSATIASHFSLDITKNAKVRCINLNDPTIISCFANDFGYENWISKAIEFYADKDDLLILISSSGQSKNMINAAKIAKKIKIANTVTLTGFGENNPLKKRGDLNLWVNSKAYNFIENTHQIWLLLIVDLIIGKREYLQRKK